MKHKYLTDSAIETFIQAALQEDLGTGPQAGDHSSLAAVPADAQKSAQLLVKANGIVAGVALAEKIFASVDKELQIEVLVQDGSPVYVGDVVLTVSGNAQAILKAERLMLNCMQRMSGIATLTRRIVNLLQGTATQILDTRKTTPNFRIPEKWAVSIGGGTNHRFGLFDMVMLKDNHIDFSGGITQAVEATVNYLHKKGLDLKIEVETRNLKEVREALDIGKVDVIMLDNMSNEMMKEAVRLIGGKCQTEASGAITEERVEAIAQCGVDFISMGALTHSAGILDLSLKAL
ncbi:carboxylating nicotinate-nucleotide diphosphorylase [Rapidithrix thailandica]|uniref:Probable nicotinate-nucleotide pyrophosphorylase [carboxylating] n=1 Tax=Rapidithrix thailandica TaxID=413964 RepID=A0AAW9RX86_9BACT